MTRPLRPPRTETISVNVAAVSDRTAPLVLGLEPRAYRELLARHHVRHARVGRRVVARLDDVLAALDRIASEAAAAGHRRADSASTKDLETVDDVLRRLGRRRAP